MKTLNYLLSSFKYIAILFLFSFSSLFAQTETELLSALAKEEQEAINAIVLYPPETRQAILEATIYPEALVKMEKIQQQSSATFKQLMEPFSKENQQMLWDLTRYPNLIQSLLLLGEGNDEAAPRLLEEYPAVIHPRAMDAYQKHFQTLVSINTLQESADLAFETILKSYPLKTQTALRELKMFPEVLSILIDNIQLTLLIGDLYQQRPEWVLQKVDSLNLVVVQDNTKQLKNWEESLSENPQAQEELEASAEAFSEEYNYDDAYYDFDEEEYYDDRESEVIVRHYYYHYPYWLGYPYWYTAPRWRPYPYWHDWGFRYGYRGTIIFVGFPSFHFMNWYFHHAHHHYYWPHLSAHFVHHYHIHHHVRPNSITGRVHTWRKQNNTIISERWMQKDGKLANRFREYGAFEVSRTKYNRKNPRKVLTQQEYLDRNRRRYPSMQTSIKEVQSKKRVYKPAPESTPVRPSQKYPNTSAIPPKREVRKQRTTPNIQRGTDYHKKTWEKAPRRKPTTSSKPISRKKIQKPTKKQVPRTRKKGN